MTARKSWLRDAVTDANGDMDVANIGVAVLIAMIIGAVTVACVALLIGKDPQPLGVAVGAILAGFAPVLGALGVYRWGDAKRPPPAEKE